MNFFLVPAYYIFQSANHSRPTLFNLMQVKLFFGSIFLSLAHSILVLMLVEVSERASVIE